ncbi:MAG: hypothetical protein GY740_02080 [Gammaproteobacteria bacterium]|nr:hypothetical protein [Gammaproteobacteria bacterium]
MQVITFQLPPVQDMQIFADPNPAEFCDRWSPFRMFELTEVMRQREDLEAAALFNRVREGNQTPEDVAALMARNISQEEAFAMIDEDDVQILSPTNVVVNQYNERLYHRSKRKKMEETAVDRFERFTNRQHLAKAKTRLDFLDKQEKPNNTGGAPKKIAFVIGQRVECIRNVDLTDGLVNGAEGVVRFLEPNKRTVWVEFSEETVGEKLRNLPEIQRRLRENDELSELGDEKFKWTPMVPGEFVFQVGKTSVGSCFFLLFSSLTCVYAILLTAEMCFALQSATER